MLIVVLLGLVPQVIPQSSGSPRRPPISTPWAALRSHGRMCYNPSGWRGPRPQFLTVLCGSHGQPGWRPLSTPLLALTASREQTGWPTEVTVQRARNHFLWPSFIPSSLGSSLWSQKAQLIENHTRFPFSERWCSFHVPAARVLQMTPLRSSKPAGPCGRVKTHFFIPSTSHGKTCFPRRLHKEPPGHCLGIVG